MADIMIKRLKLEAMPDGRLEPIRRGGVLPPVGEGYWDAVMMDPRLRPPESETRFDKDSPHASYRLDRQRGYELTIRCDCGLSRTIDKDIQLLVSETERSHATPPIRGYLLPAGKSLVARECGFLKYSHYQRASWLRGGRIEPTTFRL